MGGSFLHDGGLTRPLQQNGAPDMTGFEAGSCSRKADRSISLGVGMGITRLGSGRSMQYSIVTAAIYD
jgi:hypothetical protein